MTLLSFGVRKVRVIRIGRFAQRWNFGFIQIPPNGRPSPPDSRHSWMRSADLSSTKLWFPEIAYHGMLIDVPVARFSI